MVKKLFSAHSMSPSWYKPIISQYNYDIIVNSRPQLMPQTYVITTISN